MSCDVNETTPTSKGKVQPLLENSFGWVIWQFEQVEAERKK